MKMLQRPVMPVVAPMSAEKFEQTTAKFEHYEHNKAAFNIRGAAVLNTFWTFIQQGGRAAWGADDFAAAWETLQTGERLVRDGGGVIPEGFGSTPAAKAVEDMLGDLKKVVDDLRRAIPTEAATQ
jgi:hypothetical protein